MSKEGKKKSIFRRWWFWVIVVIVIIGAAAGAGGGSDSASNDSNSSGSKDTTATTTAPKSDTKAKDDKKAEKPAEKKDPSEVTHKIGDAVNINGVVVTIKSAKFTKQAEYSASKNGKIITIEVSAKNESSDSQVMVDNTEFTISDANGNMGEDYFGYNDIAISGQINKGKTLEGKLYFDVKDSDKYELQYKPMFSFDNKTYTWEISKSELQ